MPAADLKEILAQARAVGEARQAREAEVRQRLADLLAYANRAQHPGTRESARLHQKPSETLACIQNYVLETLAIFDRDTCQHGFAASCPENCN
jgi:hypothetical protein